MVDLTGVKGAFNIDLEWSVEGDSADALSATLKGPAGPGRAENWRCEKCRSICWSSIKRSSRPKISLMPHLTGKM